MLQFWFPKDIFFKYLQPMNGYSAFCRTAVLDKVTKEFSDQFCDDQIKIFENKIKEIKDRKKQSLKAKAINQEEINKILEFHAKQYQQQAMARSETQRHRFCENTILKQIRRFGYKGTPQELDDILLNWPNDGGID